MMTDRERSRRYSLAVACVATLAAVVASCTFGPRQLTKGHLAYNEAVKNSEDDELLLNIVRLRYSDTIEFMSTSSVSSQLSFTVALGAEGGDTAQFGGLAVGRGGAEYSTRPTFTFVPEGGKEFSRQLIEPVPVRLLAYLIAADWGADFLFQLLVRGANGLRNEFGLPNEGFKDLATRLGALHLQGDLHVGFVEETEALSDPIDASRVSGTDLVEAAKSGYQFRREPGQSGFVLTATKRQPVLAVEPSTDGDAVVRLLGLKPGRPYYPLKAGTIIGGTEPDAESITIRTRSLLGTIVYLTQGVRVPEKHVERGIVTEWPLGLTEELSIEDNFDVRVSTKRPDAQWAVRYRGHWFYLEDTDTASRATFLHLAELLRLGLSRGSGQQAPVLTLPVGG